MSSSLVPSNILLLADTDVEVEPKISCDDDDDGVEASENMDSLDVGAADVDEDEGWRATRDGNAANGAEADALEVAISTDL